jgi:uncharacterized protein YfaS (alpha-2-macroglobulin family)
MRLRRLSLLALSLLASACPGASPPPVPAAPSGGEPPPEEEKIVVRPSISGLGFRLTELEAGSGNPNRLVKAQALPDADAQALLARLPAFQALPGDEKDFVLREKSQPPPRTGAILSRPFPPPVQRPTPAPAEQGPLRVLRHLPEGDVTFAPHLSVTFSQPMVPVSSHGDLAGKEPPVKLRPQPPGRWRWIGTQTLLFEPEKRFPMASEFEVEVPAGTRSELGSELAAAEVWKFRTPPVKVVDSTPRGRWGQKLDVLMSMSFDQAVDGEAILKHLQVSAGGGLLGGESIPVRLATGEELERSAEARSLLARADDRDKHVFFRAVQPLPKGAEIRVTLPAKAPSAEGPRVTEKAQGFAFHTFGPLKIERAECGWRGDCAPMMPISVRFSNQVEASRFDRKMITADPPIEGLKASISHSMLTISGRTRGRTTYKITLAPEITDVHGQQLDGTRTFEIKVGSAEPALFPEERPMAVLDPEGTPTLPVYSINQKSLRARLYRVKPEDWGAYQKFRQDWDWEGKRRDPPGQLVESRVIQVEDKPDELVETPLSLKAALADGVGQLIAVVEPAVPSKDPHERPSVRTWLQVTRLGLDVFSDHEQTVAWATHLTSGAPQPGVQVSFLRGPGGTSGEDGLARFPVAGSDASILLARKGNDLAMLVGGEGSFRMHREEDHTRWFVFDDRHMYKPGEEARIKGFLRLIKGGKGEDLEQLPAGISLAWVARDARGVEIGKGQGVPVSAQGGFDFTLSIPRTPNLGYASVELSLDGGPHPGRGHHHSLQIQEFRRPEFEVTTSVSEGPHQVGRSAVMTVAARYYAGGGLPDAPVEWRVRSDEATFRPPGHVGFHFGPEPWGWWRRSHAQQKAESVETLSSRTTAQGEHRVRLDFDGMETPYPRSIQAEATVTDVNRQAWTARSNLLVHPADHYVGVRLDRSFVRAGEGIKIDTLVANLDGRAVPKQSVAVRAARLESEQIAGEWKELETDVQRCELQSGEAPVPCQIKPAQGGRYRVTAVVSDKHGRKSQTQQTFWVYGEGMVPDHGIDEGKIRVVADRDEYRPGDQAELLLFAPFAPAEGVVTLRRQGIVHLERISLKSQVQAIKVPILEGSFPSLEASVHLVGAAPRNNLAGDPDPALPPRPAYASEVVRLAVPPDARKISLQATPRDSVLEPGGSTTVDVLLKDAAGAPVAGAEVALAVVDEAVLALSGYRLPDPLDVFYTPRSGGVLSLGTRPDVLLGRVDERSMRPRPRRESKNKDAREDSEGGERVYKKSGRPMAGASKPMAKAARMPRAEPESAAPPPPPAPPGEQASEKSRGPDKPKTPIAQRSNFNALAAFVPSAVSDGEGKISISVTLPDNLTRYRVMAVAARDKSFGQGEGSLVARLPLMLRPSAPRFLNFGDRFEFPVVVQNQGNAPVEVDLVARAANALLPEGSGRRFTVPANARVEVRLPAAALKPGTARFQIGIASGRFADASTVDMPVWTPATTEAFATYGQIDEGAIAQPVKMPAGVVKEFGGLEISTSSTALSALTDAFVYLVSYPFDCNEQIASRMLSIASLRDVLSAFKARGLPPPAALQASMKSDLTRLQGRQHWNGGFSFWGRDREPWPYLTAHVLHAVARAMDKGYAPPPAMVTSGLSYLKAIESHIPWYYSTESRRYITAYALYVRRLLGDPDPARARRLIDEAGGVEKTPLEALGWLLPVLAGDSKSAATSEAIMKFLANRVSETAGAAHFVTSYSDGAHVLLHSARTADGILLDALIGQDPKSDLIPKLVAGLLNQRKAGRWSSTQENAFILLALDRYFNTYEKATPDFVARAWLGEHFAGEQPYRGRSTDISEIKVPMKLLAEVGEAPVTIQKEGAGRLYFRIGMQYAPADLKPPPADHGFSVRRTYEAIEDADDVRRDADGTWRVKAGAKVRVRLGMVAPGRRYHVALVDPLPAGFEAMNPALAVTGSIPADPKKEVSPTWWWSRSWYEHQNLRDERAEAFASLLYEGVYDYSYVARATTPGTFVVPPPKAEEMYAPETFGRGAGDRVIIE